MAELPDYELLKDGGEPPSPPEPGHATRRWALPALLVAVAIVAGYFVFGGRRPAQPAATEAPAGVEATAEPVRPLGGDRDVIDVPPLDDSDPLVRELVRKLSSHPRVAAWLATDGLIRGFAVAAVNVAEGKSPAPHLAVLRPSSGFRVIERAGAGGWYLDPQSYERYNALADAVASVDPVGGARLYATLKPRIEEAYRELGLPDTSFDRTLERAIARLLETPEVGDPVRIEPLDEGIGYGFADPRIEALSGAQKQLLRMGPRNAETVKGRLRQIAIELGIPSSRLRAARTSTPETR